MSSLRGCGKSQVRCFRSNIVVTSLSPYLLSLFIITPVNCIALLSYIIILYIAIIVRKLQEIKAVKACNNKKSIHNLDLIPINPDAVTGIGPCTFRSNFKLLSPLLSFPNQKMSAYLSELPRKTQSAAYILRCFLRRSLNPPSRP